MWRALKIETGDVHVYPLQDREEHQTEVRRCLCAPRVMVNETGGVVIVHNAFDGREILGGAYLYAFTCGTN